jgi:lipopolysaccharide O-acetyltransferase
MSLPLKFLAYLISLPARLKGMKFGRHSFIGPHYDFLAVRLDHIVLKDEVQIGSYAWLQTFDEGHIIIGEHTNIGRHVTISALKNITIGKNCLISYHVSLLDHQHHFAYNLSPFQTGLTTPRPITIGNNCFIGAHSFIMAGVTLGDNCVVGANSVVTKSFPAHSVIAGSPAKLLKTLRKD